MREAVRRFTFVGAAVSLLVVAGMASGAAASPAAPAADPAALSGHGVSNDAAGIAAIDEFWTDERIRSAKPVPLPVRSSPRDGQRASVLSAQSGEGSAPDGGSGDTGSSLAAVEQAQRWNRQGSNPARTFGRILFSTANGGTGACSGSIITAGNSNTVWTAGHCIHPGGTGAGNYYQNFIFIPDNDNGAEPWGRWYYKWANTTVGWQDDQDYDLDIAAIAFWPSGQRGNLQTTLGSQGYRFGFGEDFANVHEFGYPADGYNRTDFTGLNLWYCQGEVEGESIFNDTMEAQCDMGRGASGGPWVEDLQTSRGWGYIIGSSSHRDGDENGNFINNSLYAAESGDGAINVYNDVSVR